MFKHDQNNTFCKKAKNKQAAKKDRRVSSMVQTCKVAGLPRCMSRLLSTRGALWYGHQPRPGTPNWGGGGVGLPRPTHPIFPLENGHFWPPASTSNLTSAPGGKKYNDPLPLLPAPPQGVRISLKESLHPLEFLYFTMQK